MVTWYHELACNTVHQKRFCSIEERMFLNSSYVMSLKVTASGGSFEGMTGMMLTTC